MTRFAVSFISFYDSPLTTYIVSAPDWIKALDIARPGYGDWALKQGSLEDAQSAAFDADFQFDVVEIPND